MCGICGAINFSGIKKSDKEKVRQISNSLSYRGPDNEGFYDSDNVSFGHRRLSIVDLSKDSNQPMISSDESIIIVFNGEIYNSDEIRNELGDEYNFKTSHSDTETIIYAYKKWGIKAVEKFVGMFALAIFDKTKEKCFLFRDRLGQKPLYYSIVDGTFYFSSEIQPLFNANVLDKEIDEESIYHYLTILTVNAPNTFFKNVYKLEASHYIEVSKTELKAKKYWDISDYINLEKNLSNKEAVKETETLLKKSMEYRNVSDVPISIALSGGLDSSLNLHYSSLNNKENISCLNLSYEKESEYDESKIAKKYAKDKNVNFVSKKVSDEDFTNWINEYLSIQKDSPSGDVNTSLVYGMSLIAKDMNAKVMLVGEGGDELGGYPMYMFYYKLQKYLVKSPKFILNLISSLSPKLKNEIELFKRGNNYGIRSFILGFREHEKRTFWKKEIKSNSYDILLDYMDQIHIKSSDSFYRKILNVEYKLRLPELILPRIDYPSMAASIEARSPFMDHNLIAFTASLPFDLKMKKTTKLILKEIAKDKLPSYILNQPKVGFGQLLIPFFNKTLPLWYKEEILDNKSPLEEYISFEYLKSLYDKKEFKYRMWLLYSLHKWLKANV